MTMPADDIVTSRLVLRLMQDAVVAACLTGDVALAGRLLDAAVPDELLEDLAGLRLGRERLRKDPRYLPWSTRAIILSRERVMVGHVRFHTRPDPEYLRPHARDAVEVGYLVFSKFRGRGYATEAANAAMDWARTSFGIRRFIASVSPDNVASLRLVARCGFAKIGEAMDEVDGIEHVFLRSLPGRVCGRHRRVLPA